MDAAQAPIDLTTLGGDGWILTGPSNSYRAGISVAVVGDINGDGFDDLLVGIPYAGGGKAYLVLGKGSGFTTANLTTPVPTPGFLINGELGNSTYRTGFSVAAAGDINNDGYDDFIIGNPTNSDDGTSSGKAFIIYGRATGNTFVNLSSFPAARAFSIQGDDAGDRLGQSVASAGDINNDGFDDLIIGASGADVGGTSVGKAYVIFGHTGTFGNIDITGLDSATGFTIIGAAGDGAGTTVSSAGDVNNDGFDDMLVGAPSGAGGKGVAYLIFGKASGWADINLAGLTTADGIAITAPTNLDGARVSAAGDINGDGFDDILVGANGSDIGGNGSGTVYVIFGKGAAFDNINLGALAPADGFRIQGAAGADDTGYAISAAGDFNNDGVADFIVSARTSDTGGTDSGAVYLIYGRTSGLGTIYLSALAERDGFRIQGDNAGDQAGYSVSGGGDVNNDGYDDIIVGAPFGDDVSSQAGEAYVIFGRATPIDGGTPEAVDDILAATEDTPITYAAADLLGNDTDPQNDTRTILSLVQGPNGTAVLNGDGTISFTPNANFFGLASFGYVIGDGNGGTDTGSVTINVAPVNDAPVTVNDTRAAIFPSVAVTYAASELLRNDSDIDGGTLTISAVANPVNGTVVLNPDGSVTFTPSGSYNGAGSFSYTISDGNGGMKTGTVTVTGVIDVTLADLVIRDGFYIQGDVGADNAGRSVSTAGDFNNDGIDDVIIGAEGSDVGGSNSGAAYILFGKASGLATLDLSNFSAANGIVIRGGPASGLLGYSVSNAGDFNNDGIDDVIIGAIGNADGGTGAGKAYVIFGKDAGLTNLNVGSLTAADGFSIQGDLGGDQAGYSVSAAGDVNNDGFDDVIIGARMNDAAGSNAGAAYVVFGKDTGIGDIDLSSFAAADGFLLRGSGAASQAGISVSSAGDINGDGCDDLIVGASLADGAPGTDHGKTYVVYGKETGLADVDLANIAAGDGFVITGGTAGMNSGRGVSTAGDINGDGYDDLVIGAYRDGAGGASAGRAFVIFGKQDPIGNLNLGSLTAADGFWIQGDNAGDQLGFSVSNAGDFNNDGYDDIIVGAANHNSGGSAAGAAYLIYGRASGFANIDLTSLTLLQGFKIQGDRPVDTLGVSVSAAGDINNDGYDDLIVGAPARSSTGSDGGAFGDQAGAAYVIFGRATNFAPVAGNDVLAAVEDTPITFLESDLLTGDSDGDGGTLTLLSVTSGTGGTVVLNPDDSVTFTPGANFSGAASFTYVVGDGQGGTATGTVTVNVAPVNDAPVNTVPADGAVTGAEDTSIAVTGMTIVDVDAGAATISVSLSTDQGILHVSESVPGGVTSVTGNDSGTVLLSGTLAQINATLAAANAVLLDAGANFSGPVQITLATDDGGATGPIAGQDSDSFRIDVTPVDDAPVVDLDGGAAGVDRTTSYAEDGAPAPIGAGISVSDADPGALIAGATVTLTDLVAGDHLTLDPLPGGFNAITTTNAGSIVIEISGSGTVAQYQAILATIAYASSSEDPTLGGTDTSRTITVTVTDGALTSAVATTTVNIGAIDDAAVAQPDVFTISESGTISGGDLFADNGAGVDGDPDGPPLAIAAVNGSAGNVGTQIILASGALLTVGADGAFDYDPNGAFLATPAPGSGGSNTLGHDSFTYQLASGNTVTVSIALTGIDSDDTLRGTAGADVLAGGAGNDYYFIENAADQVVETSGEGADRVFASTSWTLSAGAEVEIFSTSSHAGTAAINLTGNELANLIYGNDGANILDGGTGADTLVGRLGDDSFFVDNAGDRVNEAAGQGSDRVFASVSWTLGAGVSVETIGTTDDAGANAINLTGNELANTIDGNDGANILDGRGGADTLVGRLGNDWFYVDNAGDQVVDGVGQGSDRVFAATSWTLSAGAEVELLSTVFHAGTAAIDLTGNELANTIFGNDGVNVLDGKGGNDVLIGRAGADLFAFTTALGANNVDRLDEFTAGSDRIQLDDAIFTAVGALGALDAGAFVTGSAAQDAGDRIVYNAATGQLFYDADGNGAGAAVQFALLHPGVGLVASDFQVI